MILLALIAIPSWIKTSAIITIGAILLLAFLDAGPALSSDSEERSLDYHRTNGQYRVLYSDGYLSMPFLLHTAKFYASHFGGKVVPRNYDGPHKQLPGRKQS